MTKIISYLALIVVVLIYKADSRTCKDVGEKCKSNNDCNSGRCRQKRCAISTYTSDKALRAPHQLRLGDMKTQPSVSSYSGVLGKNNRWKNGKMPYELDPAFTKSERKLILKSLKTIETSTCVDFVKRKNQKDWVYFDRGVDQGCASDVGRQGGKQILDLEVSKKKGEPDCMNEETIIHETLHALGFHHEQNRYDRDNYVTVNWDNIACSFQYNFDKESPDSITTFGLPYDYVSIMHYGNNEGGIDPDVPVFIAKPKRRKIGGDKLSRSDIVKINKMYCPK
ncbi:unnamed protein product [Allacma fusca]|uniref:Peptidase M12A domain-containing protein n=1 Tax=Allacma fusca TaxID=39272 RepID=A0A8J2P9Z3_9HEXA|nr:unnamed protein product [Allacma fusca]